jgi:hypothetical protein
MVIINIIHFHQEFISVHIYEERNLYQYYIRVLHLIFVRHDQYLILHFIITFSDHLKYLLCKDRYSNRQQKGVNIYYISIS